MDEKQVIRSQAELDGMWVEIRQNRDDIETIAKYGLPEPDDEGAAERQRKLVGMMACLIAVELTTRDLTV